MNHKLIGIRTLITAAVLWIMLYLVGSLFRWYVVFCEMNAYCSSQLQMYLGYSLLLLPVLIILSYVGNLLFALWQERKEKAQTIKTS